MEPIPKPALYLGLAGLLPFVWGALTALSPTLSGWAMGFVTPMYVGAYVSLTYGTIILAFMSGVLWGFASRATEGSSPMDYVFSVIPALWAFFMVNGQDAGASAINLAAGFAGLLLLDWHFWKKGAAPDWWLGLRAGLTVVVLICLSVLIVL